MMDMLTLAVRILTGASWDGRRRTDAGWWRRGELAHPDGLAEGVRPRVMRWHFWPRTARAAAVWAVLALLVWLFLPADVPGVAERWAHVGVWHRDPSSVETWSARLVWATLWATLCVAGWRGADAAMRRGQRKEWLWPLHRVLADAVGVSPDLHPKHYIVLPRRFPLGRESIWVILPANFSKAIPHIDEEADHSRPVSQPLRGEELKQLISEKLPLKKRQFVFHLKGRNHWLEIRPIPQPPKSAKFSNPAVRALVESAPDHAPPIGLTALPLGGKVSAAEREAGGRLESIDLRAETPHLGIWAAPGAGKSVTAAAAMTHTLHHGGYVVVLDRRRDSHKWAKNLPGVIYVTKLQDIHNALVLIGHEANRRMDWLEDHDDNEGPPTIKAKHGKPIPLPRILIVCEETNATIELLELLWKEHKSSDDSKMSPAMVGYRDVAFMGRKPRIHLLIIGQSADAQGMGGRNIRETLQGGKLLAKWSVQQWRMAVPECPMPRKSSIPGRWQFVKNGIRREVQILWYDEPSERRDNSVLREWATNGLDPHGVPVVESRPESPLGEALKLAHGQLLRSEAHAAEFLRSLTDSQTPQGNAVQGNPPVSLTADGEAPRLALVLSEPAQSPSEDPEGIEDADLVDEPAPADALRLVDLRTAAEGNPDKGVAPVVAATLTTLRWARANDPEFPDPAKKSGSTFHYRATDLRWWESNRERAGKDETA